MCNKILLELTNGQKTICKDLAKQHLSKLYEEIDKLKDIEPAEKFMMLYATLDSMKFALDEFLKERGKAIERKK